MPKFTVTYEVVTPESAEQGDAAERGFAMPGGWKHETAEGCELSLRDALHVCCGPFECSTHPAKYARPGDWFTTIDGELDYRTGAETRYSIHPPRNITPSSARRLARLLCR